MTEETLRPEAQRGLSQAERVLNTFVAPAATFKDILRSASWWLPCVLMIIGSLASGFAVQQKVGFDRVNENPAKKHFPCVLHQLN